VAKTTATRESVKEAIAALWPDGIPLSMELQQRDERIIAWQRLKQSKVASPKSIRRYLSRDGRLDNPQMSRVVQSWPALSSALHNILAIVLPSQRM